MTAPKPAQLFEVDAPPRRVRRVRRGVDATVKALRDGGRLEPVDAALVAVARTLADALDDERIDVDGSAFTVGALAGKLTPVLDRLRGQAVPDGFDDELRAALFGPLPDAPPT